MPQSGNIAKVRLVVQLNLLLMELHLGEVDKCKLHCQQYLRSASAMVELWVMYAWIEQAAHNYDDTERIFVTLVQRYPEQFSGWHAYALFTLMHKARRHTLFNLLLHSYVSASQGVAPALSVLAHSVAQFLPSKPALNQKIPLDLARCVFRSLLQLPVSYADFTMRDREGNNTPASCLGTGV